MGKAPKDPTAILPGRRFRSPKGAFAVVRRDRSGNVLLRSDDGSEDWIRVVAMESMIARKHLLPIAKHTYDDGPQRNAAEGSPPAFDPGGHDVPPMGPNEGQFALGL